WLVTGAATGYVHHVINDPTATDPSAVRCILSCDPSLRLRNSRAIEVAPGAKVPAFDNLGDPSMFRTAQIRFVLWKAEKCTAHPDSILFFRMGDFYEMFHDDAVVASRALDLTLTSRNKGAADEIPMAGVPHHAATGYIARLLALGHKVAICEQMADPSKTRGIVPRAVVRVITPGLITDGEQLDGRVNHFLCALEGGAG